MRVGAVALARTAGTDVTATGATVDRTYAPDPRAAEVHDRLQPIFEAAFSANAPICQALGS